MSGTSSFRCLWWFWLIHWLCFGCYVLSLFWKKFTNTRKSIRTLNWNKVFFINRMIQVGRFVSSENIQKRDQFSINVIPEWIANGIALRFQRQQYSHLHLNISNQCDHQFGIGIEGYHLMARVLSHHFAGWSKLKFVNILHARDQTLCDEIAFGQCWCILAHNFNKEEF